MAKGQKRSNREAKKPKKSAAERLKTAQGAASPLLSRGGNKGAPKKP